MKPIYLLVFMFLFLSRFANGQSVKVDMTSLPEWQKAFLGEVLFSAYYISGRSMEGGEVFKKSNDAFVIISCAPKGKIEKRILWADIDLMLSDEKIISLDRVDLNVIGDSVGLDIKKLPREVELSNGVVAIKIKSVAIK
jgi:hypothetical protein